jgi:hypothetical protein
MFEVKSVSFINNVEISSTQFFHVTYFSLNAWERMLPNRHQQISIADSIFTRFNSSLPKPIANTVANTG